jgi:protein-S-isoprenylcysteine O-methyltransferase Ste14
MKPATLAAAILLTVVALLQLLRAVAGVRVMIGDTVIPIWVSVVAFVVAGGLAIGLWREMKPATLGAAILLTVVAPLQLLRAVAGVHVMIADTVIPIWVSVLGFVVAGGLAIGLWREARRNG